MAETSPLHLQTKISAEFVTQVPPESVAEQVSLDALNMHAEDICESLQPIFRQLIIEMLELKRKTFSQGG